MEWYLVMVFITGLVSQTCCLCTFPTSVQNTGPEQGNFWHSHVRPLEDLDVNITFTENAVEARIFRYGNEQQHLKGTCDSYDNQSDIYRLTMINLPENVSFYFCVKFIVRTPNVIETMYDEHKNISDVPACDTVDDLHFSNWPLIADRRRGETDKEWTPCPLSGGYHFVIWEGSGQHMEPTCPDYPNPSLLWAECLPGDALQLQFPHELCLPPNAEWDTDEKLLCLESWTSNGSDFTVLGRADEETYLAEYILRTPTDHGDNFMMEMYQDLVIIHNQHATKELPEDINYILFNMTALDDLNLCIDELDSCDLIDDICEFKPFHQLCRKTCGTCDFASEKQCNFTMDYQGIWHVINEDKQQELLILNDTLYVEGFSTFTCREEVREGTFVLYSSFSNGCSPQICCVVLNKASDALLRYKIGQGSTDLTASGTYLCGEERFVNDPVPLYDTYRSKQLKNAIDVDDMLEQSTQCSLGDVLVLDSVNDKDVHCNGTLTDTTQNGTMMELDLTCDQEEDNYINLDFYCVDVVPMTSPNTSAILTHFTIGASTKLNCWIFVKSDQGMTFVQLQSAQCNEDTLTDVASGRRPYFLSGKGYLVSDGEEMTTTSDDHERSPDHGMSTGQVVGIVFGCLLGGVLVVIVAFLSWRFYKVRRQPYRIL